MAVIPYRDWSLFGRDWSPFTQLREEINRLFNSVDESDTSGATATWIPPVDIYEYDDRFELKVDLPGVNPSDVEVTLDRGVLTLSGERPEERVVQKGDRDVRVRLERGHGRFYRRFILPDSVDTERIEAKGRNGVLEIRIQKQASAQPKRIKVAA
ncbi:MAG TPA: Hsp20/alpha crystallin family protein [Steroidobacteraceae bacterium]|jgi:HSP20 family protein